MGTQEKARTEHSVKPHYADAVTSIVELNGEPQYYINRARRVGKYGIDITGYEPLDTESNLVEGIDGIHFIPGLLTPEGGVAPVAGAAASLGAMAFTHRSLRKNIPQVDVHNPNRRRTAITDQAIVVNLAAGAITEVFGVEKQDRAGHSMGLITAVESVLTMAPDDPRHPRSIVGVSPAGFTQQELRENVFGHARHLGGMYGIELRPNFAAFLEHAPDDIKRQFLMHIGSAPLRACMEGYGTLSTNITKEDILAIQARRVRVGRLDAENDEFTPPLLGNHINKHLDWRGEMSGGLHFDLMSNPVRIADEVIFALQEMNSPQQSTKVAV